MHDFEMDPGNAAFHCSVMEANRPTSPSYTDFLRNLQDLMMIGLESAAIWFHDDWHVLPANEMPALGSCDSSVILKRPSFIGVGIALTG